MPVQFAEWDAIAYLQRYLTHNKARGMVAEIALAEYLRDDAGTAARKLLPGAWLVSPKTPEASRHRYALFVHPELQRDEPELRATIGASEHDRGFQSLAIFLIGSGIGVIVSAAVSTAAQPDPVALTWRNFIYHDERLVMQPGDAPFERWPGNRGRASTGTVWQPDVVHRYITAGVEPLTALALRQAFFYGYLKERLKKPLSDPYDIDGFLVGYRGAVMPVEVKEKSPTPDGQFGIDAGRILMLLRLCLATDSNALYLIREVDVGAGRVFVNWRFVTLSALLMGCSWNLQAGGAGMGGGATQTVMIPGSLFAPFNQSVLSEDWLHAHGSLQESVRAIARELIEDMARFL